MFASVHKLIHHQESCFHANSEQSFWQRNGTSLLSPTGFWDVCFEWQTISIYCNIFNLSCRGFDIGNHFCEWCYNYKITEPPYFEANLDHYPNREQQVCTVPSEIMFDLAIIANKYNNVLLILSWHSSLPNHHHHHHFILKTSALLHFKLGLDDCPPQGKLLTFSNTLQG